MKKIIIPIAALIMFAMCKKVERKISVIIPPDRPSSDQITCNSPNKMTMDLTLLSNSE